jgi:hypothetical protein
LCYLLFSLCRSSPSWTLRAAHGGQQHPFSSNACLVCIMFESFLLQIKYFLDTPPPAGTTTFFLSQSVANACPWYMTWFVLCRPNTSWTLWAAHDGQQYPSSSIVCLVSLCVYFPFVSVLLQIQYFLDTPAPQRATLRPKGYEDDPPPAPAPPPPAADGAADGAAAAGADGEAAAAATAPDERTLLFKLFEILRTCDWQVGPGTRGVCCKGGGPKGPAGVVGGQQLQPGCVLNCVYAT